MSFSSESEARKYLRAVIPKHEDYLLYHIPLQDSDQGVDVMLKLGRAIEASHSCSANWLIKAVPFVTHVVYTAKLSPTPANAISRDLPCAIDIETECRCQTLTKALKIHREFPNNGDFLACYGHFVAGDETPGAGDARDVLLVRLQLDKPSLWVFIIFSIIISIVCGIVAGICQRSSDTGLGVFSAVIVVIGIVEGGFTYMLR